MLLKSRIAGVVLATVAAIGRVPGCAAAAGQVTFPPHLTGTTSAVTALLERVLPGSSSHFSLSIVSGCPGVPNGTACFTLADGADGTTVVTGTSASELTGGIGVYFREYCDITVGWVRGGGSNVFTPSPWPKVGPAGLTRSRAGPYSHVTQVCTHSYTLVWHDWAQWEQFIDWMALAGHNSIVAPTGQEEVQYKVFTEQFGVSDMAVRNWTNGPGFLTWSRGQNSHGNGIAGPLPRSFMRGQWTLQQQIMTRYRELGIAGHQPAFGGYAPWALAVAQNDTGKNGATRGKIGKDWDTAWIDGRDPLYTRVADAWMKQIIADFGTDHVWQMDAFFSNGTGWGADEPVAPTPPPPTVPCEWSAVHPGTYLKGCATASQASRNHNAGDPHAHSDTGARPPEKCPSFQTVAEAEAACVSDTYPTCSGITTRTSGVELRAGPAPIPIGAGANESSYLILNAAACKGRAPPPPPDPVWLARGKAAYGAVARADGPTARWIYQGWTLYVRGDGLNPVGPTALSHLHGFSSAAPPGQFILLDMNKVGLGEWKEWGGQWGIPFIWTSLHVFGGNQGLKGNMSEINAIPFEAPPFTPAPPSYDPATVAVGVGYTPEGLDQNPAYYELLQEAAFKAAPEPNLTAWLGKRAHRRYGLPNDNADDVASAWADLGASVYSNDAGVHDGSGIGLMPAEGYPSWAGFSGQAPKPAACLIWRAWGSLLTAADRVATPRPETYTYDLVDTGREALSQLSIPVSLNFSGALKGHLSAARITETGGLYRQLLLDLDSLLVTHPSFLLGTWLASARALGGNATDCNDTAIGDLACPDFMEWNARAQVTTWKPTVSPAKLSAGPIDYARKHWAGLVADYYAERVNQYTQQGLADATSGRPFDGATMQGRLAKLAFGWQTAFGNNYTTVPIGDAVAVSATLRQKYAHFFSTCP